MYIKRSILCECQDLSSGRRVGVFVIVIRDVDDDKAFDPL